MSTTMSNEQILDAIGNKTVIELADLIESFKTKFNVTVMAAPAAGAGAGAAPAAEEQSEYSIVLTSGGAKKIQVIKAVREVTSLGLKEAKDLVDAAPKPVKEGIAKDEADKIKAALEEQGAKVEIK